MSELSRLRDENKSLHYHLADFERLNAIFKTLSSTLQVKKLLELIITEAISLCHASQGSILLFDPQKRKIAKTLIKSGKTGVHRIDHYLNNILAGWVYDHMQILQSNQLIKIFNENIIKKEYRDIKSVLCVPITNQTEVLGVMNMISLDKAHLFSEREIGLMESLATQCVHIIRNAKSHESLFRETKRLRKELQSKYTYHDMLGRSAKIRDVYALLERIIPTDARVLIEGESGTGKELIARILHYNGPHKTGPFIAVDCGAFPENLLESELFGYVKGAFTGAINDKSGLFEEAQGGTLFLDEITNMPLNVQSKLLRALQEGEIRPVGSTKVKKVSARILAAASDNFRVSVDQGKLREDLYYRLNVVNVNLPPLRERVDDIPLLVQHFLSKLSKKYKKNILGLKSETLNIMENYPWPGNIRELENIIERMIILAEPETEYIYPDLLPPELIEGKVTSISDIKNSDLEKNSDMMAKKSNFEKKILSEALENNQWNQSSAARELNIPESTLRYKMKKLDIRKQSFS
jgi:transcriptional regulator with PAS, ATPase and Fis domain